MIELDETRFRQIVADAIDAIPSPFGENIANLVFVVEDDPSPDQRIKLKLRHDQTLFGLYEGIPLPQRGAGYNLVLPDKITVFKNPALQYCDSIDELKKHIKHTVWHEVAHYYGLDHDRIYELEQKS